MKKEDILLQAQQENNGKDIADLEAQKKGARMAYTIGIILIVIANLIEGFVFDHISYSGAMAAFAMGFTAFLIKYLTLRKKHELIIALIYGSITAMWAVMWILQLCRVIA